MKFLCPSCKAKYQIADEKILGRTLKMTCRRCNTAITVRGDLPGAGDAEAVAELDAGAAAKPAAASPAGPTPSARPHAQPGATAAALAAGGGSALGADFRKQGLAPAEARTATIEQWHVAINEVPVGPMRREEVSRKMATGAVSAESLAWREGFDDWRPVRDIPELAALLRKPEAAAPPRGLPAPRAGAAARPTPVAAPLAGRATPRTAAPASPSALGASAKGASVAPSARSNVVPIGGRLGGAATALDEDEQSADEPTQIASMRDLGLLAAEQAQAQKDGKRAANPAAAPADAKKPASPGSTVGEAGGPEAAANASPAAASVELTKASPAAGAPLGNPYTAAAGRTESATPAGAGTPEPAAAASSAPPAAGGDDGLPPLLEAPPPAFVTPTGPPPPAAPLSEAPAPSVPPRRAAERRGIPVGGWIAIAGSVAFGGVFAVIAAQRLLPPPPAAPAPAAATATLAPPAAPTPPPTPPPVAEPAAPAEAAPEAAAAETAETGAAEAAAEPASGRTGTRHRGGTTAPAATGTAAAGGTRPLSPDFARLSEDSTSLPAISGGAASRRLGGEPSGSGARRELSADEIREVVSRERTGLTRCWETAIRGMRETPTVRLDVSVTIGTSGAVTNAAARGPTVGSLTECIERSVRRWHFPPSGGTTETSFPVVFSGSS